MNSRERVFRALAKKTVDRLPTDFHALEIIEERLIEKLGKEGGYILSGSQEYIEDIPVENIIAIYDENMRSVG